MKNLISILCFLIILNGYSQQIISPFIPDIVKQFPNVRDIAISPNGEEVMFTAQSVLGNMSTIISIKREGQIWLDPKVASFSGQYFDLEPFFSLDGLKAFFVSSRPLDQSSMIPKDFDIWYVERNAVEKEWSKPKNLGKTVNTEFDEFYPSIAKNGNLYFTRDDTTLNQKDDIYFSKYKEGLFLKALRLPNAINSEGYEYNGFIAPDESFLIYGCYNREGGFGSGDLFISYNSQNGWSPPINLGKSINSDKMDYCPFVDTNTSILYFTSKVDHTKTQFKNPLTINELLEEFNKYDNGQSRLYSITIKTLLKI